MFDQALISHHIQKYILRQLLHAKVARFRDLRPPAVDSNLYNYHLKILLRDGYVIKVDGGYSLGLVGLNYVDRINAETVNVRQQPKIITMMVITNGKGDILLQKRRKQPYIDTWTLPYGKLHVDDKSVVESAKREASEKLGLDDLDVDHIGECYIRVRSGGAILSSTLAHIFRGVTDNVELNPSLQWFKIESIDQLMLAPAVERIVGCSVNSAVRFFEEFDHNW